MTGSGSQPRSALNLRLVLALVGLVACGVLAVALFWTGYPVAGWLAVVDRLESPPARLAAGQLPQQVKDLLRTPDRSRYAAAGDR